MKMFKRSRLSVPFSPNVFLRVFIKSSYYKKLNVIIMAEVMSIMRIKVIEERSSKFDQI